MQTFSKILLLLTAGAMIAACGQDATTIGDDGVYRGALTADSDKLGDGSAYARYTIDLQAGEELDVIMQSGDFDPYLRVEGPDGDVLSEDDDSAGGFNARIVALAPIGGRYTILANSYEEGGFGNYLISVQRKTSGTLEGVYSDVLPAVGGKTFSANEYPTYDIDASAGDLLDVFLTSGAFDAYLQITDADGRILDENDDAGGGTNARLSVPILADGTYTIVVKSYEDGETGPYRLAIRRDSNAVTSADARSMDRLTGTLSASNERLDDDTPFVVHEIEASAGELIEISMRSDAFDTYLLLWTADDAVLAEDDDSGDGLNSRLSIVIPADGQYKIVANAVGEDAEGDYSITLRRSSTEAQIASGELRLLSGSLSASGDTLQDGSPYSAHEIVARAGERLEVTMMSADFDAYLLLFDANETMIGEDDDSAGGSNAKLFVVIPEDGTYRLIANSYTEGADGQYTITVRR